MASQQKTIYFSYFIPRFLFFLSIFLDFIKLPKSNSFLWHFDMANQTTENQLIGMLNKLVNWKA